MAFLFSAAGLAYVLAYAFEGVLRYGLYLTGASSLILLRDALLVLPLLWLAIAQAKNLRVHPAYFVFFGIILVHGAIIYANVGDTTPAIYGIKLLIGELFGFIAAAQITRPNAKLIGILLVVWLVTLAGVGIEKFVTEFPWVGLQTDIGGIKVDIAHGWDIQDPFQKRAGGLTRSSICAAIILPVLAIIICTRTRRFLPRLVILSATLFGVFLTTQKGSLIALTAVAFLLLFMPRRAQYTALALAAAGFLVLDILLPVVTSGMIITAHGGVFSLDSFALRMDWMWPDAWRYIANNQVGPLGVGLGGIGGAQRFFARDFFNPCDNIFIFVYGNFGIFGLFYLAWPIVQAFRVPRYVREEALSAVALLAFLMGYGAVLSLMEDQLCALFLGASAGMLWQLRERASGRIWSNPYSGWDFERPGARYAPSPEMVPDLPARPVTGRYAAP